MRRFKLINETVRVLASHAVLDAPVGWEVIVREPRRNLEQNSAMWVVLEALSSNLKWPINGHLEHVTPDDWKTITTAAFQSETRVAEGLNGGHVFLGLSTSQMSKRQFSEYLEFLHSVASERGVKI